MLKTCEQCQVLLTVIEIDNSLMLCSDTGDVVFKYNECSQPKLIVSLDRYDNAVYESVYDARHG